MADDWRSGLSTDWRKGVEPSGGNDAQLEELQRKEAGKDVRFSLLGAPDQMPFAGTQAGTKTQGVGPDDYLQRQSVPVKDSGDKLKEWLGRGANAVSMGASGAPMGPVGVGAMGILGAMMPPTDTPGTDVGATLAGLAADRVIPGGSSASKLLRMLRGGAVTGATMGGAALGSEFDKQGGLVTSTPTGKIMLYGAGTGMGEGLKALTAPSFGGDATNAAAQKIKTFTGIDIPLAVDERTGALDGLTSALLTGTGANTQLARNQSEAFTSAIEKIVGKSLGQTDELVKASMGDKYKAHQIISTWAKKWRGENSAFDPDAFGANTMTAADGSTIHGTLNAPSKADWNQFQDLYKLTREERDTLFTAINVRPAQFVDQMLPGSGPGAYKGYVALNALMKVLPEAEANRLGSAVVLRMIGKSGAVERTLEGPVLSGAKFSKAMFDGEKQLRLVLGDERADAMMVLADLMKDIDPASKVNPNAISQVRHTLSYSANKMAFALSSIASGAALGAKSPGDALVGAGVGALAGAGAIIPLTTVVGNLLANPKAGKVLLEASKGSATAATAFLRTLISQTSAGDEDTQRMGSARSRLEGLFKKP